MLINPQRAKLDSELADIDQQLQSVSSSFLLSNGQKVLYTRHLQHQRQEKSLEVEILEQGAKLESCEHDVEEQQKRYKWAQSATGHSVLRSQEIRRVAASSLGEYDPSERLIPEQRGLERVKNGLERAEELLRNTKSKLAESKKQLQEVQAQDAEWDAVLDKTGSKGFLSPASHDLEFQLRMQRGADALARSSFARSKMTPIGSKSEVHYATQMPPPTESLRGSRHIFASATMAPKEEDDEPIFSASDSYQKIRFWSKDYDLTRHRRAASIVRILDEARKKGQLGVSSEEIRTAIGLKHGGKMYDWFRHTGLWKTLVVEVETGVYRLDIPIADT